MMIIPTTHTPESAPPLPAKDDMMGNPPPYTPSPEHRTQAGEVRPPLHPKPTVSSAASVNQVHIFSKQENIVGTFYIDPHTPAISHGDGPTIRTRHGKQRSKKGKNKGKADLPHASFQTRSANMKLHLASTISTGRREGPEKDQAKVFVGSRSGKIEVTMLPRDVTTQSRMTISQPFMGLEVFSRTGNVIVYLPETFSGVLRVESTKGEMRFLPALASGMRVLKSTDRETIATLGDGEGDLCDVFTRSGRIVVGLAGRDEFKEDVGFWRRLFVGK